MQNYYFSTKNHSNEFVEINRKNGQIVKERIGSFNYPVSSSLQIIVSYGVSSNLLHSDGHDVKHGTRSGTDQLPERSETTKPGASSRPQDTVRNSPTM